MSDITNRLRELAHAVADQRWSEFSMRVPADRGRDADLVLMRAADEITQLRAENARLIAAAPELAEALKEARPCVEEIADQVDCTAPHKAASIYALLARIDAALAKAGVK